MERDPSLIARTSEQQLFEQLMADVVRNGFRVLTVEGEAGIGKTELVNGFRRHAARVGHALGLTVERGQPPLQTASDLLAAVVGRGYTDGFVVGDRGELSPGQLESARRDAWRPAVEALTAAAGSSPSLLLIDDAHWLDDASATFLLDLMEAAAEELRTAALLLVLAHRPVAPDLPAYKLLSSLHQFPHVTTLSLRPLDEAETLLAIEQLGVHRPSPTYVEAVYRASQGNPLMVRAAVEILQYRGVPPRLQADDRRSFGTLRPDRLDDDPIRDWVGRLAAGPAAILGAGALWGTELTLDEVAVVADVGPEEAGRSIDEALALGLLRTDGVLHWFAHPLVRAELDRRVPTFERQLAHARCARLARSRMAGDPAAAAKAAEHLLLGDRGVDDPTRLEILEAAERWAADRGAWSAATRFAQGAAEVGHRLDLPPDRQLELTFRAAEAAFFDNDWERALSILVEVSGQALANGLRELGGRALLLEARVRNTSNSDAWRATVETDRLEHFAASAATATERVNAYELLSEIASSGGRLRDAVTWADEAIRHFDHTVGPRPRILALGARGYACLSALDLDGATDGYTRAIDLAERSGDRWLQCGMLTRLAFIHHPAGRLAEAAALADQAAALAAPRRDFTNEGLCEALLGQIAVVRGDFSRLERHQARARAIGSRAGYPMVLFMLYPALLFAAHARGDRRELEQLLNEWAEMQPDMARTIGRYRAALIPDASPSLGSERGRARDFKQTTIGLACLVLDTASDGELVDAEAQDLLTRAVDGGIEFAFTWPASTARVLGDTLRRVGRLEEAQERYLGAIPRLEEASAAVELARVHLGLAGLGVTLGDGRAVRRHARVAIDLGQKLELPALSLPAAALQRRMLGAESPPEGDSGFMAILITDIVGSTDVSVALGDIAYHRLVSEHHRLVRQQLESFGGHEFSEGGDSLLAWFDDAEAAVGCALAIQEEVERGPRRSSGLAVRIGLAGGHPLVVDGRPYGSVVNLAARVTSSTGPGEVVAEDSLMQRCRRPSLEHRQVRFKGFPYVHSVHRLRAGMYPNAPSPLLDPRDG